MPEKTKCPKCNSDAYLFARCPKCNTKCNYFISDSKYSRLPPSENMPVTSQRSPNAPDLNLSLTYYCSKCGNIPNEYQASQMKSGFNIKCQNCGNTLFTLIKPPTTPQHTENISKKEAHHSKQDSPKIIKCIFYNLKKKCVF